MMSSSSSSSGSRNGHHGHRESLIAGRSFLPAGTGSLSHSSHRRGHSLNGFSTSKDTADESLDLFSKNRRVASSSEVSVKLGRLSVGSAKPAKSGFDDLLSSTDGGKHDYDWLLTPPGTPLFPSSDGCDSQTTTMAPRSSSLSRSVSTTKASRLSVSQSDHHHSVRPTRSSSLTRSSISSSQFSTYSSNRSSSILNTSSASVSSYTRPSSPVTRSSSTTRPSTPSARPMASRASTPSRVRPTPTSTSIDKSRQPQSSRPSTPNSRAQVPSNLNSTTIRSNSRPSTPTRRNPVPAVIPASSPSTSAGRVPSSGRNSAPPSRPSSPSPRVRTPQQPVVPPDFPLDTPPNLRTTLPDRPLSAGRSRPGGAVVMKGSPETNGQSNVPRRHSSPIVSRGRLAEAPGKTRIHSNGHVTDMSEPRKVSHVSDLGMRKPTKSSATSTDCNGFGRTISKKSLDMAIRHMDIRNGNGSTRALSSTTLFPQSIRAASKTQSVRSMNSPESINNGGIPDNGPNHQMSKPVEYGSGANDGRYSAKLSELDIYESSRYDAILLKEDLKNTNWLHSIDDKSDQGSIFDNGFEPLPEPFAPL